MRILFLGWISNGHVRLTFPLVKELICNRGMTINRAKSYAKENFHYLTLSVFHLVQTQAIQKNICLGC